MQSDCQVTTSELDQLASSSFIAYRHDHGRMATLAHDGWVRVFAPGEAEQQWDLLAQIQVDAGRLIQGCWAHAEYGALLAVLTEQGDIIILEEATASGQKVLRETAHALHEGCRVLSFGPPEQGLQLASACSNGRIRIQQAEEGKAGRTWVQQHHFKASDSGACTAMCWRPQSKHLPPMSLLGTEQGAKIFFYDGSRMSWEQATQFAEGAIADVAWTTPAAGHAPEYVATASGRTASVWKLAGSADKLQASKDAALDHAVDICQVEWNGSGTWLAVATQDGKLSLWRQNLLGSWKLVSTTVCVDPGSYSMID